MRPLLEVCCSDADSVAAAAKGGADRIELCCSLETGGLTPSAGLLRRAIAEFPGPVNVLIRPRGGDFLYDEGECDVMCDDIREAVAVGASAIVVGALTPHGDVDMPLCRRMLEAGRGVQATFHRAFDLCRDPQQALEEIIELGFTHLLTSGLGADAVAGMEMLRSLEIQASGRISIIAAGGVNAANAPEIVRGSGVHELHASAKHLVASLMEFRRGDVNMGARGSDEYSRPTTDASAVKAIVRALNNM